MSRKSQDRCAGCSKNENGMRCRDARPEWHNGKYCNVYVKKHTERVRIIVHPRLDFATFYSDMER